MSEFKGTPGPRTMIPLDYDREAGYLVWRMYVRQSVTDATTAPERLVLEAQRLLTKDARYTPYTINNGKRPVHGERIDRIVYMCLIIGAIIAASIWK